jgi:hypothetical protein
VGWSIWIHYWRRNWHIQKNQNSSSDELLGAINNFAYFAADTPIGIDYILMNDSEKMFSANSETYGNESGNMTWLAAFQNTKKFDLFRSIICL